MRRIGVKQYAISSLLSAFVFSIVAYFTLPSSSISFDDISRPFKVDSGLPSSIEFHVGDIAIPKPIDQSDLDKTLNYSREQYWTSSIITSPAPELVNDNTISVPWTVMPNSVARVFGAIDQETAIEFVEWTISANNPRNWIRGKYRAFDINKESKLYRLTMYERIYGVNLFDYFKDYEGKEYRKMLKETISDTTYEVLRDASENKQSSIAIPALAAGQSYVDNYLVLPYQESFSSILDGVVRAGGDAPGRIVLVVWSGLKGHDEFNFAKNGLLIAAYKKLPSWKSSYQKVALLTIIGSILLSSFVCYFSRKTFRLASIQTISLSLISSIPLIAGYWYVSLIKDKLSPMYNPLMEIATIALLTSLLVVFLHKVRIIDLVKLSYNKQMQPTQKTRG